MLTLTQNAEEAVRQIVANSPIAEDTGGLRIAPGEPTPDGVPLELTIVGSPEPDDTDAGTPAAHVYLEPTAAEALEDKVLDAEVDGNNIGFALLDATAPPPSNNGNGPTTG
jgi:Fe-S cluster assembly iron-binding protein IscA